MKDITLIVLKAFSILVFEELLGLVTREQRIYPWKHILYPGCLRVQFLYPHKRLQFLYPDTREQIL